MATKRSQRIGIWIIAITLTVGTLGGFLVMILAPGNQKSDQARLETLSAEYQKQTEEYQKKIAARDEQIAKDTSKKYFDTFKPFASHVAKFSANDVTKLGKKDLTVGNGDALGADAEYAVYYIGWNPKGTMFDSSFNADKTALTMPLIHQKDGSWMFPGGQTGGVIEGWTKGLEGIKMGGVRELTLPSDLAYGEQGGGENIPANTPLRFIIMVIPAPKIDNTIEQPKMSDELKRLYSQINKIDPRYLEGM